MSICSAPFTYKNNGAMQINWLIDCYNLQCYPGSSADIKFSNCYLSLFTFRQFLSLHQFPTSHVYLPVQPFHSGCQVPLPLLTRELNRKRRRCVFYVDSNSTVAKNVPVTFNRRAYILCYSHVLFRLLFYICCKCSKSNNDGIAAAANRNLDDV